MSTGRQSSGRVLSPISTNTGPSSDPVSRTAALTSPSSLTHNASAVAANRQVTSRHSSTSSTNSLVSPNHPTQFHSSSRSRVTSASSPRLTPSLAGLAASSPTLNARPSSAGGPHQLASLITTQLNILLSTLKEHNFDTQVEKILKLVDDNGMAAFTALFRRLVQSAASTIFPSSARPAAAADTSGNYKLLTEEVSKVSRDPQQAEKIAQSLDTSESEIFRDFDLSTFIDHFGLNPIAKVALVLPVRTVSKPDLRSKGETFRASCA
jgi:CCR4-NOT transcription complex subunit 1